MSYDTYIVIDTFSKLIINCTLMHYIKLLLSLIVNIHLLSGLWCFFDLVFWVAQRRCPLLISMQCCCSFAVSISNETVCDSILPLNTRFRLPRKTFQSRTINEFRTRDANYFPSQWHFVRSFWYSINYEKIFFVVNTHYYGSLFHSIIIDIYIFFLN